MTISQAGLVAQSAAIDVAKDCAEDDVYIRLRTTDGCDDCRAACLVSIHVAQCRTAIDATIDGGWCLTLTDGSDVDFYITFNECEFTLTAAKDDVLYGSAFARGRSDGT